MKNTFILYILNIIKSISISLLTEIMASDKIETDIIGVLCKLYIWFIFPALWRVLGNKPIVLRVLYAALGLCHKNSIYHI